MLTSCYHDQGGTDLRLRCCWSIDWLVWWNVTYIKHNNPQSAYALHILNKKHKYGPINDTMILLKHINKTKTTLLIQFEQLYIQSYHHNKQLTPEQHMGEHNPIYHLIHDPRNTSHPTRLTNQYSNINVVGMYNILL